MKKPGVISMSCVKLFLFCVMSLFISFSTAAQTSQPPTVAQIKQQLINNLQHDGYISKENALTASNKYISSQDNQSYIQSEATHWTKYLSFINFVKILGLILLLLAFGKTIGKFIRYSWYWIIKVPAIIYQGLFLAGSLYATLFPQLIWTSQAFYVALLASFANIIIIGWISAIYPSIILKIKQYIGKTIAPQVLLSTLLMLYFGGLAFAYQSNLFGFFAAVALSGIFSFTLIYTPGTLYLYFKDNALGALVWGHILVLAGYMSLHGLNIGQGFLKYFDTGLQYYCTIALGVGLLVGASPFYQPSKAKGYALLFLMLFITSTFLYFFTPFTVVATIMMIFFSLFFLEWIAYMGFKGHAIIGYAIVGGFLYAISLILEKHGEFILHNLKNIVG